MHAIIFPTFFTFNFQESKIAGDTTMSLYDTRIRLLNVFNLNWSFIVNFQRHSLQAPSKSSILSQQMVSSRCARLSVTKSLTAIVLWQPLIVALLLDRVGSRLRMYLVKNLIQFLFLHEY